VDDARRAVDERRKAPYLENKVLSLMLLPLMAPQVIVGGEATCPSARAVATHLAALLAEGEGTVPDRADVAASADGMVIDLRRADGTRVAVRRVARSGSCDDMAEAAAVVLATWETRMRAGWDGVQEIDIGAPPEAVRVDPLAPPRAEQPARVEPSRGVPIDVGAGGIASFIGSDAAPGGYLELLLHTGRLVLHAGAAGWGSRRIAFDQGFAVYRRVAAGVGAGWELESRSLFASVEGDLWGALLSVRGEGYAVDRTQQSFDPGLSAGVRAGVRLGSIRPYAGGMIGYWLRPQALSLEGNPSVPHLGHLETSVLVGLLFRVGG
jgi:hypothetical protein